MAGTVDSASSAVFDRDNPEDVERRIFRGMVWTVVASVLVSAPIAHWRITTGILVGGTLSILNYHWLRTSIRAVFAVNEAGKAPRFKLSRYVLRYFIVGAGVFLAHALNLVSLPATIAALCSIVVPFLGEAILQLYYAIIYRED
jgi:hypothetical protein